MLGGDAIARLRQEVREAADEFCRARRQLGEVLRARRTLRRRVRALEGADRAAEAAVGAAKKECRRWASEELPASLARLEQQDQATIERQAAKATTTAEEVREVARLRSLSDHQSRQLQALALRCAGLEARLKGRVDSGQPLSPSAPALAVSDCLAELDRLQLELLRERSEYRREAQALCAELSALRSSRNSGRRDTTRIAGATASPDGCSGGDLGGSSPYS